MEPEAASAEAIQESARIEQRLQLESRHKGGAAWFFWIAGLSMLNTIVGLTGGEWGFIFGLAVTQVVDEIAKMTGGGGVATVAALIIDVFIAGILVLIGVFARKGHVWAYWLGMVLYAMDGLVSLIIGFWLGVAFHAFALFSIY
ncbi:MAG: hypothetical protein ACRESV_07685, partial [Nevskiales bacterium]